MIAELARAGHKSCTSAFLIQSRLYSRTAFSHRGGSARETRAINLLGPENKEERRSSPTCVKKPLFVAPRIQVSKSVGNLLNNKI